jgi:hypothetical protein
MSIAVEKTVPLSERITKSQNKLFEHAHSQPLELKYLGIALSKQGLQGEKWYCHPDMLPMPMRVCSYLSSLSQRQKSILSACYFANFYKFVANSESQTVVSNMAAAEKSFAPFSDEYMILHQETSEELDHIWTFRTVHSMVCRETGSSDTFDAPGFFRGKVGAMLHKDFEVTDVRFSFADEYEEILGLLKQGKGAIDTLLELFRTKDRSWRYRVLYFLIGDAMRMLSPEEVQDLGLGGLWLLYRYVSNVELKQGEAYLFDSPETYDHEPLAYQINQGHLHDEARHYTTSFDIGLAMYKAASPKAQEFIREVLKMVMNDYVSASFLTYLEMLDETDQGYVFTVVNLGLDTLRMAMHHPDFANKQADLDELVNSWKQMKWRKVVFTLTQKRWRYIAQQLDRLLKALDVDLDKARLGNLYDRFQYALTAETIQDQVLVA